MRSVSLKRVTAFGLATAMALSSTTAVVGQSDAWEAFEASLEGKYDGQTMSLIVISDPFVPAMREMNERFRELTGAEVVVDALGYDAMYQKETLECQQGSDAYDVLVVDVPWTQAFVDCLDPLNELIDAADPEVIGWEDYFRVMREAVSWDGAIVGLPFAPYFVLQHYNTDYFDTLGLTPATTFDEMLANAEAAQENPELPASTFGTILNNAAGSAVGQAFFEYIYNIEGGKPFESMYPGTEDAYADMTPLFSSPQGIEVVDFFSAMLPHQPPGALNYAWQERQSFFNTGKIAFNSQWNVTTPSATDPEQSIVVDSVGTAPFPHDSAELVTQVGGWSMGLNGNSAQKDLAWDYMQWFTSAPVNVEFSKAGGFPARQSTVDNAELNEQYPWYATLNEVIPTAFADCRPRNTESFEIINTLGTWIAKAMSGEMSSADAMAAADAEIGAMLKEAGYVVNLP